ncbi:hypothetical protein BTO22_18355 [Aliivibrio sifiae]|uniref:Uncharacterized protein n=1 Tax=Aliivibrio sifiae TaxID=566293 RepID=A0A2S7X0I4_9GAMM|nr:hypothetical protein BTO22_18355 [Aliivibrio sifiae]
MIILFVIVHVFMLYLSLSSEYINDLLGVATNGRNFIWNTQLENMTSYSILWSDVEAATVPISWSIGETNNSHNAFLFLIFRIGGLSCLLLFLSFFIKSFKSTYHNKLLLMAFLAAGISNSNMLYIGNPIYFYIVFFALFYRDEEFS